LLSDALINWLHSREHVASAFLYGFDLLTVDGMDLRRERLDDRLAKLHQLLRRPDSIRFSEHHADDGEIMFRHASKLGLEGIVSKRRDAPYRSGRCREWVKVNNPESRRCCGWRSGRGAFEKSQ
jgi:ATP-dependent DNA ligase